jgi:predicted lysophospholipase L1 biosynthesis ABC-type transport system permease subunit
VKTPPGFERDTLGMLRPTRTMVLTGHTTDGIPVYRPLTPEAAMLLAGVTNQGATGRPLNVKPPAPVRAGLHRRGWPTWFLVGVLALLALFLAGLIWVAITTLTMLAAALGWLAGHLAVIIGATVVLIVVLGVAFGRRIVIKQSNTVNL